MAAFLHKFSFAPCLARLLFARGLAFFLLFAVLFASVPAMAVAAGGRITSAVPDGSTVAALRSGLVQLYVRAGDTLVPQASIHPPAHTARGFGAVQVLSDNADVLLVSAYAGDSALAARAGTAHVYVPDGEDWRVAATLRASDGASDDQFGIAMALSADASIAAVAANRATSSGAAGAGAVYIFTRAGEVWTETARLSAGDAAAGDAFGSSLALSDAGDRLFVGATGVDRPDRENSGAVYAFTRTGEDWTETQKIVAADASVGDVFGTALALSSDTTTLAVGAVGVDASHTLDNTGAAYLFSRSGETWTETQKITVDGAPAGAEYGVSLMFSPDDSQLALGAWQAKTNDTAIFSYDGGQWVPDSIFVYVSTFTASFLANATTGGVTWRLGTATVDDDAVICRFDAPEALFDDCLLF